MNLAAIQDILSDQFWFALIMIGVSLGAIVGVAAPLCILAERKLSAYIQDRKGPNRVGPWGLLQPVADGVKFILKEDIVPAYVDKPVYILAPGLALMVALLGFAVIPWADVIEWPWGTTVSTQVASLDIGFLYMLAIASLSVYGVVLAGWSSNNKYAFYGGMRATAQMLSYEVPLGLGLLCVLLVAGNLRLETIVDQQAATGIWYVFVHPVPFLLVLIGAFAETNRTPFDLAEAEQELVGGYHTEYSAMKFAMFFLAEYTHMVINSALMIAVFFGGWAPLPFTSLLADNHTWWAAVLKFGAYWGKIAAFIGFYMLIRWTIPRFRFDQLMRLAWKGLVPLGLASLLGTAVLIAFGWRIDPGAGLAGNIGPAAISFAMNAAIFGAAIWIAKRSNAPVTGRQDNLPEVEVKPA